MATGALPVPRRRQAGSVFADIAEGLRECRRPQARSAFLMLGIPLLLYILFSVVPILLSFYYSLTDFSPFGKTTTWVGLANFREAVQHEVFWATWRNTFTYAGLSIPLRLLVGFAAALLLDRKIRGISAIRTIYYVPTLTSAVAVAMVFRFVFDTRFGFANWALQAVGLPALGWLYDPKTAMATIALTSVWHGFGGVMIIYLAGLQGIPTVFYEAAAVDGANWWQRIRMITWPLLMPVTFYLVVTGVIGSVQVYDYVMIMSVPRGGPLDSTTTVVYEIYKNATTYQRLGYASAMSVVLFLVVAALTAINLKLRGERVEY